MLSWRSYARLCDPLATARYRQHVNIGVGKLYILVQASPSVFMSTLQDTPL
jgi:hypothetical protein